MVGECGALGGGCHSHHDIRVDEREDRLALLFAQPDDRILLLQVQLILCSHEPLRHAILPMHMYAGGSGSGTTQNWWALELCSASWRLLSPLSQALPSPQCFPGERPSRICRTARKSAVSRIAWAPGPPSLSRHLPGLAGPAGTALRRAHAGSITDVFQARHRCHQFSSGN